MFEFVEHHNYDKSAHKTAYMKDYRKTDNGKASKRRNRKPVTDAKYLSKRFVGVDGEGVNVRAGLRKGEHLYVMLAVSGHDPIVDPNGLSTIAILDYLFTRLNPNDINVIYGGSYDFNNWVRDLMDDEVAKLYRSNFVTSGVKFHGYTLKWMKGKAFEISREMTSGNKRTITINDVISFFQRPFIQALDEYLGEYEGRDVLVREKARRGDFRLDELDNVGAYNNIELGRLVELMIELRDRLNRSGLRPRRWNSPGAIAAALLTKEKIKDHLNQHGLPAEVSKAARYAYAGGRFEMLKYGAVKQRVYEYDINSAYPRAMLELPSLAGGRWEYLDGDAANTHYPFALYHVQFTGNDVNVPGPVFVRGENGTISYPINAENWVWSPEYAMLAPYVATVEGSSYRVLGCWRFIPANDIKPFSFIADLYAKRQLLKAAGDGAHVGIKLALNSLYGKLAQQVGWLAATDKHAVKLPTYHQLEYAGFVTSWCRAHVLEAALTNMDAIIAFETDALFSSEPLNVKTGTELGQWEQTTFRSLTYVQSGHYYATKTDGKSVIKCRGVDKGFISRSQVERLLSNPESTRVLEAKLTRFYGAGIALMRGLRKYWCKWLTEPKQLTLMPTGKRVHGACWCSGGALELGKWHLTYCPTSGGVSHEYPVEWINPDPNMTELSEMRESENFYAE